MRFARQRVGGPPQRIVGLAQAWMGSLFYTFDVSFTVKSKRKDLAAWSAEAPSQGSHLPKSTCNLGNRSANKLGCTQRSAAPAPLQCPASRPPAERHREAPEVRSSGEAAQGKANATPVSPATRAARLRKHAFLNIGRPGERGWIQ